jgi:hypothetical protein
VKNIRKQWSMILVLFFLACMLLGGGIAYAAPMLWSYPDDHVLISEVNYTGAPGMGVGTEWIELYNPTNNDTASLFIDFYSNESFHAYVNTPTPGPNGTVTPYPISSHCFVYIAYDAATFYSEYNQCPDFANISDPVNCPNTIHAYYSNEIMDNDMNLCFFNGVLVDAVGWGNGNTGSNFCRSIVNPLSGNLASGETLLRGSDAPEWIGPGAEGVETPGAPLTEQLDEVWHLSGSVDVPWEGPEVGACRQPTAIGLQNPRANAAQDGGYALLLFGLIGLAVTTTAIVWRKGQNIPIERSE